MPYKTFNSTFAYSFIQSFSFTFITKHLDDWIASQPKNKLLFSLEIQLPLTLFISSLSVAIIAAAIAGPNWLFTSERLSKQYLNGTIQYKPRGDDTDYITKFTKSSLWILCTELGEFDSNFLIDSFECFMVLLYCCCSKEIEFFKPCRTVSFEWRAS